VTPLVQSLLLIIEQLLVQNQQQAEELERLKDEINILKGQKKRPVFEGSKLDKKISAKNAAAKRNKKRPGSEKKKKTQKLVVHEDRVIQPDVPIPEGSRFKGYRYFTVQDLHISVHTTRYCLERWVTPANKTLTGQLPTSLDNRHFGAQLVSYILYQHHHCQTTQPLLLEQLREWGVELSSGQINHLLLSGKDRFHCEKDTLLQTGLAVSPYITVDDSGARHQGKNGYVTQMGNEFFAWFQSTDSKSRINFLELLRVLDRPEIPLHTKGSETDIRDYVKKPKVSGATRSDQGRQCRDTFASLKKTCRKLDISFWHYRLDRLGAGLQPIPPLSDVIAERAHFATGY